MPGMRSTEARTPARPRWRTARSAFTRRWARGVPGATVRVSGTRAPWQSPYTPLVDAYANDAGRLRSRSARASATVRGSRHQASPPAPSPGGGARCSTRVARPDSLRNVPASSRLPTSGRAPARAAPAPAPRWRSAPEPACGQPQGRSAHCAAPVDLHHHSPRSAGVRGESGLAGRRGGFGLKAKSGPSVDYKSPRGYPLHDQC